MRGRDGGDGVELDARGDAGVTREGRHEGGIEDLVVERVPLVLLLSVGTYFTFGLRTPSISNALLPIDQQEKFPTRKLASPRFAITSK